LTARNGAKSTVGEIELTAHKDINAGHNEVTTVHKDMNTGREELMMGKVLCSPQNSGCSVLSQRSVDGPQRRAHGPQRGDDSPQRHEHGP